jgi:hypothetical protein
MICYFHAYVNTCVMSIGGIYCECSIKWKQCMYGLFSTWIVIQMWYYTVQDQAILYFLTAQFGIELLKTILKSATNNMFWVIITTVARDH